MGVVADGQIALEARTNSREELSALMEAYCASFRKERCVVQIVMVEQPKAPLKESELAAGARLSAAPAKLTKAFFMKQPEDVFLASHIIGPGFEPVFAERIGSVDTRQAQWERIRAAGADQRASHLFPSQAHYGQWLDQFRESFRSRRDTGSPTR